MCTPCPLVVRTERPLECTVASQRSEAFARAFLDQPLLTTKGAAVVPSDDGHPALNLEGRRQRLSASGLKTWQAIDQGITVRQLAARVIPGKPRESHLRDLIEFVHALRRAGLVRLRADKQGQLPIRCVLVCCAR